MRLLKVEFTVLTAYGHWNGGVVMSWPETARDWPLRTKIGQEALERALEKIDLGDLPCITIQYKSMPVSEKEHRKFVEHSGMVYGTFATDLTLVNHPILFNGKKV